MYAVIELLENIIFDQFGINYPSNKTIHGMLVGTITKHDTTFIIVQDITKEVTAYNTNYFSIMYLELEDFSFKFKEESTTSIGTTNTRRCVYADCSDTDQKEILEECQRYVKHREVGPTSKICPGCFNPTPDWHNLPSRWKNKKEENVFPSDSELACKKPETQIIEGYPKVWDINNKSTTYTVPKKSVISFKRKEKLTKEELEDMRKKVTILNTKKIVSTPAKVKIEEKDIRGAMLDPSIEEDKRYFDNFYK